MQRSADKKTNFLKVSAPWELLAKYAEILNLKMPIKVREQLTLEILVLTYILVFKIELRELNLKV